MSLHYSSGKLLLKNTTDNQWYYLSASLLSDGSVYLKVHQDSQGTLSLVNYDTYAIIRAVDGVLYKLSLVTNGSGVVDYSFNVAILPVTQSPVRIWIKDVDTGGLYELTGEVAEATGLIYPRLNSYNAAVNTLLDRPFKCQVSATATANSCRHLASFYALAQVVIPPFSGATNPIPSNGDEILGENGESILGEGGENILGEDSSQTSEEVLGENSESVLGENNENILGEN